MDEHDTDEEMKMTEADEIKRVIDMYTNQAAASKLRKEKRKKKKKLIADDEMLESDDSSIESDITSDSEKFSDSSDSDD